MKNRNKKLPQVIEIYEKAIRNRVNEMAIIAFCFGIGLLIWSSILFDRTMIHPLAVWLILLFPGLPMTFLFHKQVNKMVKKEMHIMLHYVFHAFTTGSAIAFIFLAANFYLSSANTNKIMVEILGFDSRNGGKGRSKRTPYALIKYHDLEKAYLLNESQVNYLGNREEMIIETRIGFFGFDVIQK